MQYGTGEEHSIFDVLHGLPTAFRHNELCRHNEQRKTACTKYIKGWTQW